jgi:hypothetical protein
MLRLVNLLTPYSVLKAGRQKLALHDESAKEERNCLIWLKIFAPQGGD